MLDFVTFDGTFINGSNGIDVWVPSDTEVSFPLSVEVLERERREPLRLGSSRPERTLSFNAVRENPTVTHDDFLELFYKDEPSTLVIIYDGDLYEVEADVQNISISGESGYYYTGEFVILTPWKSTVNSTATTTPFSVGGNYYTYATAVISPSGTTVRRSKLQVTDNTGRGLSNKLVRFDFDSTGLGITSKENFEVIYEGLSVPFYVIDVNTVTTKLWLRMNINANATSEAILHYGSSVDNTRTANKLITNGINLDTSSNSELFWNNWILTTNPNIDGVWHLGIFSPTHDNCGVLAESIGEITLVGNHETSDEDVITGRQFNAVILNTGVAANDATGLQNMIRTFRRTGGDAENIAIIISYLDASGIWKVSKRSITSSPTPQIEDDDINIPGAISIAIYILRSSTSNAMLTIGVQSITEGPASSASNDSLAGNAWTNLGNVLVDNSNFTLSNISGGGNSQYLTITDLGFDLEEDSTVVGIRARTRIRASALNAVLDYRIRLIKNGTILDHDKANLIDTWGSLETRNYGHSGDLWNTEFLYSDINNSGFGFALAAQNTAGTAREARVEYVDITVWYVGEDNEIRMQFRSVEIPTVNVTAPEVVHLLDGELTVVHPDTTESKITFDKVYIPDEDLIIDSEFQRITTEEGSKYYSTGKAIQFTDGARWLVLKPGEQSYTNVPNTTTEFIWRNRVVVL